MYTCVLWGHQLYIDELISKNKKASNLEFRNSK